MTSRSALIDLFLANNGWQGAKRTALAGDASFRRYERVYLDGKKAVLMDATPDKEDIRPFIHIAQLLAKHDLSAPSLLAQDISQGLLLLEDLGDDLFARVLHNNPAQEEMLYLAATEVLAELYAAAPHAEYTNVAPYNEALLAREYSLLSEWFLPLVLSDSARELASKEYHAIWQAILPHLPALQPVLVLRDYHAENLLWLPERAGTKRIGLLDFQDAVIGSPAYDVVSFLEDARRDVRAETVERICKAYCTMTGIDQDVFATAYALLGAQRNCKIIGIFCRLAVRDNKPHYLSLLPRVWRHLENDLQHPVLKKLSVWCNRYISSDARGALTLNPPAKQAL